MPRLARRDLLVHLIEMNDIWGWLVMNRPRDFSDGFEGVAIPAAHTDRLDLLDATNHQLVEALRHVGADEPVCYFGTLAPAIRVARLMAVETVVHSRDAEQAAGLPATPIATDVAADGVAQQLAHLDDGNDAPWLPSGVSLTSTDTGDSWTVLLAEGDLDGTLHVVDGAPVGAQVSAPAAALLPWLFARSFDDSVVTESGDPSLLRTLRLALGHEVAPAERIGRRRWWGR